MSWRMSYRKSNLKKKKGKGKEEIVLYSLSKWRSRWIVLAFDIFDLPKGWSRALTAKLEGFQFSVQYSVLRSSQCLGLHASRLMLQQTLAWFVVLLETFTFRTF